MSNLDPRFAPKTSTNTEKAAPQATTMGDALPLLRRIVARLSDLPHPPELTIKRYLGQVCEVSLDNVVDGIRLGNTCSDGAWIVVFDKGGEEVPLGDGDELEEFARWYLDDGGQSADDDEWRWEMAREAGMLGGINAYNDALGLGSAEEPSP